MGLDLERPGFLHCSLQMMLSCWLQYVVTCDLHWGSSSSEGRSRLRGSIQVPCGDHGWISRSNSRLDSETLGQDPKSRSSDPRGWCQGAPWTWDEEVCHRKRLRLKQLILQQEEPPEVVQTFASDATWMGRCVDAGRMSGQCLAAGL